jgi:predicted transcriptional regulator of viral defense system
MKKDYLLDLFNLNQTVFTVKNISLLWQTADMPFVNKKLYRYTKANKLFRIKKAIYAKNEKFDRLEFAVKLWTPSYISFETVTAKAGLTFQYYSQIFIATYQSKEIEILKQKYVFRKLKDSVLTNLAGIENTGTYNIASAERAFLDIIYLNKNYYFDNLSNLNWDKVFEILPIYQNKNMIKMVNKHYKESKNA